MRVLVALAATALAIVVVSATASASAYPPVTRTVTASPSSGLPGYRVSITARCTPGETVRVELGDSSVEVVCRSVDDADGSEADSDLDGAVSVTLNAPTTPGEHRGAADGATSGELGGFVIRVEAAGGANSSAPLSDEIGIDWGEVFRYTSFGTMFVAFLAVPMLLRRRYTFA